MLVSNYAIKFRTAVFVFVLVIVVLGSVSYVMLPREGAPDITIPYLFVSAAYEGLAPEEVENLITIPLEKKFNDLPNIKEMRSSSAEGIALIVLEFTPEQNIDDAVQKVKDKIDQATPDLPDDLDEPEVRDINFSTDWPVLDFTLSGEVSPERLKSIAEDLEETIEAIPEVLQANVYGTREREIRVEVDLQRLIAYRMPLATVTAVLHRENATVSAGNIESGSGDKLQLRVPGEFVDVSEIERLLLGTRDGKPVYLADVAAVRDTYKDLTSISRLNGRPCVTVSVQKRSGTNSIAVIDRVKKAIGAYRLPPVITATVTNDQSRDIRMMLSELENNVATGFVLVVAVLMIFMGLRNSLLVALAIPLSMLISFTVLKSFGVTLNMLVLFGLVLSLGMLVDNAIVIVENIFRHHCEGETRRTAARTGASEVAWPVITSTLTTLAAFSPLLFWPDIIGEFMSFLPRTLICTLSASLFVAVVINPAVSSAIIKRQTRHVIHYVGERHRCLNLYERFLRCALNRRGWVMTFGLATLAGTLVGFARYGQGVELFPDTDPRSCTIQVRYPEGTSIHTVDAALRAIEARLGRYADVKFYVSNAGSLGGGFIGGESGTHVGAIQVRFLDFEDRREPSNELVSRIRSEMPPLPGAEIRVEKEREGPPAEPPVSIEISGDDFGELSRLAAEVQRRVKDVPALVDLQDDVEEARPELRFRVDRQRAALLGADTRSVGNVLRSLVTGEEATRFRAGEDEYDITVRLPETQRRSVELFRQLRVVTGHGDLVPLSSLGSVTYAGGRGAIRRKDQHRTITITGNNQGRGVDRILVDVRRRLADLELPKGYSLAYTGDTEQMRESGVFLLRAFGIAVGLILVILVLQFNSVLLPGVIMGSVLLSLIGVMWGLLVCGMRFGVIMTGVGVISLAGVVVNNAIVLIACVRQQREAGLPSAEALVAAGRLRLRPVLLTATTTILGLIPMAVGYSVQVHEFPPRMAVGTETSAWWAPMAVAVIFGLGVATVLTLVLVPVMYSLSDSLVGWLRWYFRIGADD